MYFFGICVFCWNIQDTIYDKSRNLKLQDNVTCCKRTGALNVGLMKTYNGPSTL